MLKHITSIWNRENRNNINSAIDVINQQGRSIQDLVAEGQLTPSQYAELLKVINGLVKKGEIKITDIDKNNFEIDQTYLADELLQQIAGTAEINAVPADGSLTTEKYADNSVTVEKTAFIEGSKNIASGSYLEWGVVDYNGALHLQRERAGFNTRGKLIKVIPNTEYTASRQGEGSRFAIVGFDEYPSFSIENLYTKPDEIIIDDRNKEFHTFTTGENTNYIYFYVDNAAMEPEIQVEYGDERTPYTSPHVIVKKYVEPVIKETIKENLDTVTIIEDIEKGYPKRPDATSVIWIGVNEPTEAEVFDEWREVEGFTYYTDFTEYAVDEIPNDWVEKWLVGDRKIISDSTAPNGGKALQFNPISNGFHALSWGVLDSDNQKTDAEVYVKGRVVTFTDTQSLSIVLRGSGEGTKANGYTIGVRNRTTGAIRLSKYVNGVSTNLQQVTTGLDFGEYFNMIGRIDGNRIRFKCWQHGTVEPNTWLIDIIDSSISTQGFVGVFNYYNTGVYVDSVGIGTGGMRSTRRKLI